MPQSHESRLVEALYGLVGFPLGHSFSRAFFAEKFAAEGIDAEYRNFELPDISALPQLIAGHPNLRGLNVTIPHKQAVIPLLDDMSDEARIIGAVNVVRIDRYVPGHTQTSDCPSSAARLSDCRLTGFNSDVIGFRDSLRPLLQPHHAKALVLGTGGASKAVCRALDTLGITWRYVSRSRTTLSSTLTYAELTPAVIADNTLIINCTPLGMSPKTDACPDIPYDAITPRHLLYDLVYNPEETLFLRRGRERGATIKNGLEMLHLQAIASWHFWNREL